MDFAAALKRYIFYPLHMNQSGYYDYYRVVPRLAVLEFNASRFPDSPYVYESLAEAYLMAGHSKRAVTALKKLLGLSPDSRYARKKLAQISQKEDRK
jgi:predicted Zn-dependent protease